jgi:RNA polymerase-binding transcription factor DksA
MKKNKNKKAAKKTAKKVAKAVKPAKKISKAAKSAKKAKPVKATKTVAKKSKPAKKVQPLKKIKKIAKKPVNNIAKKTVKKNAKKAVESVKVKKTVKIVKAKTSVKSTAEKVKTTVKSIIKKIIPQNFKMKEMPRQKAPERMSPGHERSRYSDEDLKEFKGIIINKLDDARKELNNLQAALTNSNDHGTDDTASTFKMLEDGSDTLAKEEAGQLAARQRKFIDQLENALVRIENKTYGICRVTGKLIPKERLRSVPHTTQSIEAKMSQHRA